MHVVVDALPSPIGQHGEVCRKLLGEGETPDMRLPGPVVTVPMKK